MAKEKVVNYPTQEWLDNWVDKWLDAHPNEKVTDFSELNAQAEDAWWLNEIEHDRATPFDLTPQQEKASKEARKGMAHKFEKRKQPIKRERKPNEEKLLLIKELGEALVRMNVENVAILKAERELTFNIGPNAYSVVLTLHRPKKTE